MAGAKRVGVLALQGDFEAHKQALARVGAEAVEVRTAAQLDDVDGLILPGGESTTMLKLLEEEGLFEPLRRFGFVARLQTQLEQRACGIKQATDRRRPGRI